MQHGKKPRKLWPKPVVRPLTWKDLRDTAASLYLRRGVPMAVVQKVLRHSDPRITSERYAHLEQDYLEPPLVSWTPEEGCTCPRWRGEHGGSSAQSLKLRPSNWSVKAARPWAKSLTSWT